MIGMRDLIDLCEGRDAHLYHFTTTNIERILSSDSLGTDHQGFVSLTRDQNIPFRSKRAVVFVLDQTKLSHRFRIEPHYGDSSGTALIKTPQDESEERVSGVIAPLHRYLISIVVDQTIMKTITELQRVSTIPEAERSDYDNAVWQHSHTAGSILRYSVLHDISVRPRDTHDPIWTMRGK